jgi:hypothetical protein
MVGHVGFGEARELAVAPVEVAAVDDDAADGGAVAADMLGRRVDDDVGAMFERTVQVRRKRGVVDDERDADFLRRRGRC